MESRSQPDNVYERYNTSIVSCPYMHTYIIDIVTSGHYFTSANSIHCNSTESSGIGQNNAVGTNDLNCSVPGKHPCMYLISTGQCCTFHTNIYRSRVSAHDREVPLSTHGRLSRTLQYSHVYVHVCHIIASTCVYKLFTLR